MSNSKNLYVLCMLILTFTNMVLVESVCDSMLLSLSSAGICEDGYCRTKEIANTRIELGQGHSFCFRIDQHQFQLVDQTVNFTVLGSWISYPVRDCYLSDDPQTVFEGYCACSLSSPVDCSNCPIDFVSPGDEICVDGVNRGTGCFGYRTASHCVKASYDGGNRYKVCNIGKAKLEVLYKFFDTNGFKTGLLEIDEGSVIKSENAQIKFHNVDNLPNINKRLVIDLLNPFRIYAIPTDKINDFDSFDPSLPGWYRQNMTIKSKLKDLISVSVPDCENDQFLFSSSHATFNYFLSTHPEYAIQTQLPGALFSDTDAEFIQTQQVIYDPPLPPLKQGAYFLSDSNEIIPFGITSESEPTQSGLYTFNGTIATNWGTFTGLEFMCSENYTLFSDMYGSLYQISQLQMCMRWDDSLDTAQFVYGFCTTTVVFNDPGIPEYTTSCEGGDDYKFKAIMWPDNVEGEWCFKQELSWHGMVFYNCGQFDQRYNISSDHVITDDFSIKADAVVEFSNITISFDVTNVQPQIVKIDNDNDMIYVWAESTTVKGNCILMTSDDLCPTKNIELTLTQNKYKLDLMVHKFKGDVVITIQCYKNKDSAKFYIEVDRGDIDIEGDTIKPNDLKRLEKDVSTLEKAQRGFSRFWEFVSDNVSWMYHLTGNAIADLVIGLLLNILTFLIFIVFVYLLLKAIWWIICWMVMKWKNRGTMMSVQNKPAQTSSKVPWWKKKNT